MARAPTSQNAPTTQTTITINQIRTLPDFPVRYPKWQPQLTAAINETDPARLLERVREVEEIFSRRLDRISGSRSHSAEIQAIEQAMDVLEVLKRRARQPKAS
jgi:ribose 1,5-bisphosphokinase PhnN